MPYGGTTRFYGLPYMEKGDMLTATEEERRAKILDNLLYAATYGATNAVIEDPLFTVADNDADWLLTLSPAGGEFVFMAVVNYRLAYREEAVSLHLAQGGFYYIYITYATGLETDPSQCGVEALETTVKSTTHTLLCTVDCTGAAPVLDTTPEGKPYMVNLAAHAADSVNPHGQLLEQYALSVTGSLAVNNQLVRPVAYAAVTAPGPDSAAYAAPPAGFAAVFAIASPANAATGVCGCEILSDGRLKITNAGAAGGAISIRMDLEWVGETE